ncbi:hypothetical protein [Curtobacterium sp. Curtsp57]|uniref:hypothetical protein n=1 Tax=Curtobacterium sp. Curtsp57 TaxID=3243047 RepID=UPI0039B387C8
MKFDSFGRPILCMPRLRFVTDPNPGDPTPGDPTPDPDPSGFPANTPVAEMTQEQQLAYWKHQSRKHERRADERKDYDQLRAAADELATLKAANQTEAEKALAEAREEARREGENLGAARYLTDAVKARFQLLTKKTDDEVATAFAHVNANSFVNDQGDINVEALTSFAGTFGASADPQTPPSDPVRAAMERQQQNPGGTSGGSIAEMTRQRVDELQGKK